MTLQAPVKLGRYRLLAKLATGGMAEIYLAKQTGIGGFERIVVIKRILPHLAKQSHFVEMFFDEARIAAQLSHPNIVQIYDLGQDGEEYFIAMEYLEGESLGFLVKEARKHKTILPSHLAAGIVAQVTDGLAYAHLLRSDDGQPLNLVHRDVSPHNIIVLFSGGVKLVDFGIAKAATQMHQTRVGVLKGKLTYISPEQCQGEPVDPRSDVFSLGVVLWEMLTRRRLFKRKSETAMINAILSEPIPLVRDVQASVAPELATVADRALRRNPRDRFQTAAEMGSALREFLRRQGAAAGVTEIAEFAGKVFADRARTKRRLLEEIRAKGTQDVSVGGLKPDTDESGSIPSASPSHPLAGAESPDPSTQVSKSDEFAEAPTTRVPPPVFDEDPIPEDGAPPETEEPTQASSVIPEPGVPALFFWPLLAVLGVVALALLYNLCSGDDKTGVGGPSTPTPLNRPDDGGDARPVEPASDGGAPAARPSPLDAGTGAHPGERVEGLEVNDAGVGPRAGDPSAPAAAARPTLLSVRSRPGGCRVEVDGIEVPGSTPLDEVAVDPDARHRVHVFCRGHKEEAKEFIGEAGEKILLEFEPERIPAPKPKAGLLYLDTVPWSEVYLGKRKLGITPLLGTKLPPGTYTLRAVNAGRDLDKTIKVHITAGKTTKMRVQLAD